MREQQPPIIDVHTHVFNARYLPLKNIFLSQLGKPNDFKRYVAENVAKLIEEATDSSYDTTAAVDVDVEPREEIWQRIRTELESRAQGFMVAAGARSKTDYVADRLETDPLFVALVDLELLMLTTGDNSYLAAEDLGDEWVNANVKAHRHAARRAAALKLTNGLDQLGAESGLFERFRLAVFWGLDLLWAAFDEAMAWWDAFGDFLTFVNRLMMAEQDIFRALTAVYKPQDVRFVHLMMDMEYAYAPVEPPRYAFAEQLTRMRRLADASGGRLIGFAAFDPRRGSFSRPKGFSGAKFYPAMGYRPWNNPDAMQALIEDFYKQCEDKQVPIFTHCTPRGFQASKGSGVNAHPKYWAEALKKYPLLRLCLGHAGGGRMENEQGRLRSPGWFAIDEEWCDPDNFARIVVELCNNYDNVFCEVGHLDGILKKRDIRKAFEENFLREWRATHAKHPFATKCMFGSDHHMARMIRRADDLFEYFRDLFDRENLEGFEGFCSGNALQYLNLHGNAATLPGP